MSRVALLAVLTTAGCFDYDYLSRQLGGGPADAASVGADAGFLHAALHPPSTALSFSSPSSDAVSELWLLSTWAGDFDSDGAPDVFAVAYSPPAGDGTLTRYRWDSGLAQVGMPLPIGSNPQVVRAADLDEDGRLDLAVCNYGHDQVPGDVAIVLGKSPMTATRTSAIGLGLESLAIAEVTGDTHLDLIVARATDAYLAVLPGDGHGGFGSETAIVIRALPEAIATGDVNGDGRADVAVAHGLADGGISVLLGRPDGGLGAPTFYPIPGGSYFVAAGDLDGDGLADLAASAIDGSQVYVFYGREDGVLDLGPTPEVGAGQPFAIAIGDLNRDGYADLAVTHESGDLKIVLGDGGRRFQPARALTAVGMGVEWITIADLDRDGRPDVLVPADGADGQNATMNVFLNVTE